eukprot:scaffold40646_cov206-Amphora_coffeaeformis.AAC.5
MVIGIAQIKFKDPLMQRRDGEFATTVSRAFDHENFLQGDAVTGLFLGRGTIRTDLTLSCGTVSHGCHVTIIEEFGGSCIGGMPVAHRTQRFHGNIKSRCCGTTRKGRSTDALWCINV